MIIQTDTERSSLNTSDVRKIEATGENTFTITYKDDKFEDVTSKDNLVELFEKDIKNPFSEMEKPLHEMLEGLKESLSRDYKPLKIPGFYCEKCDEKVLDVDVKIVHPTEEEMEKDRIIHGEPMGPMGPRGARPKSLHMKCETEVVELASRRGAGMGIYG